MRNIIPYEVGTTDDAGRYIVWGKDAEGKTYRTYVVDPSWGTMLALNSVDNLMSLAVDNDDWTLFEGDLYHGDKSPDDELTLHAYELCPKPFKHHEARDRTGACGCMPATSSDDQAAASVRQLQSNEAGQLVIGVLDMLNDHCLKQEAIYQAAADSEGAKRWWAARVHIEHCSNSVEMIKL